MRRPTCARGARAAERERARVWSGVYLCDTALEKPFTTPRPSSRWAQDAQAQTVEKQQRQLDKNTTPVCTQKHNPGLHIYTL